MAKKELAVKEEFGLVASDEVPDYIKQDSNRGSEDVTADDLVIPRLDIIQAISPELKKKDPKYIEGSEAGMLFNSVTKELYGESILVVPVIFKKQWLVWKDRNAGGGFHGAYDTPEEAANKIAELEASGDNGPFEALDTAQHLCLIVQDGKIAEIAVSMARSKMKVSRRWNSMVRMNPGDRFSRIYEIRAVEDSSDKGDFYNFDVKNAGFPTRPLYEAAEKLYNDVMRGDREVNVAADQEAGPEAEDRF